VGEQLDDAGPVDEDHLVERIRARASDPARRCDARESAFSLDVGSMGLRQVVGALRSAQADLARLLRDPLDVPPDLVAKADQLAAQMQAPADLPLPPPATPGQVEAAEAALGVRLPPLLRRLLLEVADGGFGPGYGLVGVGPAGWRAERGRDLVGLVADRRDPTAEEDGRWVWPASLLPVAHLGDVVWACLDLARPGTPVLEYDPSDLDWDDDGAPLDEQDALVEVSPSLAGWLADWVDSRTWAEQAAIQEAELAATSDEVMREQMRTWWAELPPEQRQELGITDEMLETGRWPDPWT
jgi:hypothetical protein